MSTVDDITPKLCGSTHFSKLDAKQGYWNLKLDDKSSYLTTFNTHRYSYRFLRMPFGLRMSQDIFQKEIDETHEKCRVAVGIADDINMFGRESTHDYNLQEAMERARKTGIKLNIDKCIVKSNSCSFFGEIHTPQGVKSDPKKEMQAPSTKQELHSFLGMIRYLSQFIPSMSDLTSNLRKLLKKDVLFQWTDSHEKEFQELKSKVSMMPA